MRLRNLLLWLDTRRLVVAILFVAVFAMAVRAPADTDTWWHLKAGQVTIERGRILQEDLFSHTRYGAHLARGPAFAHRYAYARAADTRVAGDVGQNYLAFRHDERFFAFALCDGLSERVYCEGRTDTSGRRSAGSTLARRHHQDTGTRAELVIASSLVMSAALRRCASATISRSCISGMRESSGSRKTSTGSRGVMV